MKTVQYFTPEYLQQCKQMTPEQILQFLEDFRLLFAASHLQRELSENRTIQITEHRKQDTP